MDYNLRTDVPSVQKGAIRRRKLAIRRQLKISEAIIEREERIMYLASMATFSELKQSVVIDDTG